MKTSKPLNDTAQWQRSDLQYPRLIAELLATGAFDTNVRTAICDSMDLEPHQLDELLRRAESDWTTIKQTILTSNKSASTLRCPHCNYNGKKPTGIPLFIRPNHLARGRQGRKGSPSGPRMVRNLR